MFQFTAPLSLLALGSLLAPILIHLARRPRRVVRVGSLGPLADALPRFQSVRWREIVLLALRCSLLAALALALAGLRWQPREPAPARWLLLVPGTVLQGADLAAWERLVAAGHEPRLLAPGFPADPARPAPEPASVDAWSLLREADALLPAGSRAVVFGPTEGRRFPGSRPVLRRVAVEWRGVAGAAPTPADVRRTLRVAIVASPSRAPDAIHLRAALTAIGATLVTDATAHVIFQLGDTPLPAPWAARVESGAWLVSDAPEGATAEEVFRQLPLGDSAAALWRRTPPPAGVALFRDSAGVPWLTEERRGAGRHWRLALRFHPQWSDWPLTSGFPAWWRSQLELAPAAPVLAAPEQAAPRLAGGANRATRADSGYGAVDLRIWCGAAGLLFFLAERWLSRRAPGARAET